MNGSGSRWRMMGLFAAILAAAVAIGMVVSSAVSSHAPVEPASPEPAESSPTASGPATATPTPSPASAPQAKLTLAQIAAPRRRVWDIEFPEYIGKPAPDFRATDLDGKDIRLSDYRGRNVLVVFWATWCAPCKREIPDLIKLRNSVPEDKLAIIAISTDRISDEAIANNTMLPELRAGLKKFANAYNVNYTVVTLPSHLDRPFATVVGLPTAFFISPDGNIKFITGGVVPLKDTEAILAAEQ